MTQRSLLEFTCDVCKAKKTVDVTESQEVTDDWPMGWVFVKLEILGVEEMDEKVYCEQHAKDAARLFGYPNYGTLVAALRATECRQDLLFSWLLLNLISLFCIVL